MTIQPAKPSAELPCHRCGYDLRAHPAAGNCPECGASVAEAIEFAAIPRRPLWREADPRWRRRMLAGVWILVLMPLVYAMFKFGWVSSVPVPRVFDFPGTLMLGESFAAQIFVHQPLLFCMGVVLLFSKERGRHRNSLDWTRRWGVLCSYVVLLLSAAPVFQICALVLAGIAALCLSMPLKYQPHTTRLFVEVSYRYLRYGPSPKDFAAVVNFAASSIAVLLGCIPLFDALRSSGSKRFAAVLTLCLASFSVVNLAQVGWYCCVASGLTQGDMGFLGLYFRTEQLIEYMAGSSQFTFGPKPTTLSAFIAEAIKWCVFATIAIWLTLAQLTAWRQRKKKPAA